MSITTTLERPLLAPAAAAGAAAAALLLVGLVDPNEPGHYPTCPFLALTGHFCPGCGALRAVHALTRGDLGHAAGSNLLAVASLPLLGWLWLAWTVRRAAGRERTGAAPAPVLWGLLMLVVVFAVARNLTVGQALAP